MTTKTWKIIFYVFTIWHTFGMAFGGVFDMIQAPEAVQMLAHLGYPAYFGSIIGAFKLLGLIALWQRRVPFLREWAYAGYFFDLVGAFASHMAVGDAFGDWFPSVLSLFIWGMSYAAFRKLEMGVSASTVEEPKKA